MTHSFSPDVPLELEQGAHDAAQDVYVFPASFAQQRMWFFYQLQPGSPFYNISTGFGLGGPLDARALARSINAIVRRHEILRTTFLAVEGRPVQVVAPDLTVPLRLADLSELPREAREAEAKRLTSAEAGRLFDLTRGPLLRTTLLRLDQTEHVLLLTTHHVVADGWSVGVLMRELATLYDAYVTGRPAPLPELPIQYADFTLWQREWLQGPVMETQLAYWREQLAGLSPLELPTDRPRPTLQTFRGGRHAFLIPQALTEALKSLSEQRGATMFMILLAAFKTLLHRYTGQGDVAVGSPIANRNRAEIEGLVGFFVNTLVLRTDLAGDPTFLELLERVREVCTGAYAHQDLPFEKVVEQLHPQRDLSRSPLFQVIFALQSALMDTMTLRDLTLSPFEPESRVVRFDLEFFVWESPEGLRGLCVYSTDLFDADTIARLAGHFCTLLAGIVANPAQRLSKLPLLTQAERQRLLVEWNATQDNFAPSQGLPALFEAQAARTPDAIAVVCGDQALTYAELNRRANQLAHHLRALGVGAETSVGLCIERSPEEIVGLLGVLKAGGACVPLAPDDPPARLTYILDDTQSPVVLTRKKYETLLSGYGGQVVRLEADGATIAAQSERDPAGGGGVDCLAWVTYPASVGIPVTQRGLVHQAHWLQQEFGLSTRDVVLYPASLARGASLGELFWPLLHGGRLAVTQDRAHPAALHRIIAQQNVTIAHFVPSTLAALAASDETGAAASSSPLRAVMCGGEPLRRTVAEAFVRRFSCALYHVYRPPEAATPVATQLCRPGAGSDFVPAGRPTPNAAIYVLDAHRQPVPVGVSGEIYVTGAGLAPGYLHDPEATDRRFVPHPYDDRPGARLFRTGDTGRWRNDGALELVGVAGQQAWVGGCRVALAEIEAALQSEPSVGESVVRARETSASGWELVAYVVPAGPFAPERLQTHLENQLPVHLRPHAWVPLSTLPLEPTGQVDEAALARLPVTDDDLARRWEACLRSAPGVEQAVVVVQEQRRRTPPLHLSDLLPDWQRALDETAAEPTPAPAPKTTAGTGAGSQKPAISHGGALELEADAPSTLAAALQRAAQQAPHKGVVYVQMDGSEIFQSYAALLADAERILAGLRGLGLRPQDKLLFQFDRNQDFVPAFWACVLGGFVPVPISIPPTYGQANSTVNKLHNAWEMLDHPIVLTGRELAPAVRSLSGLLGIEGWQVETVDDLRALERDGDWHPSAPDDLTILLLTSGSTGLPKAVTQTHHSILRRTAGTAQMNGHGRQDISLNWMPMDHVGGIVMFQIRDVYLCCQQVHVPTSYILSEPLRWLDLIERYRATMTWAPNFAYGLINDRAAEVQQRRWDLTSLRFILNAGEAIVAKTARRFMELLQPHGLPETAMHPCWGMSETCSGVTYSHNFTLETTSDADQFVEVGGPIPGFALRIVDGQDRVVHEGASGRLQVQGPMVTRGYYNNPERNREVFTEDGWFNTGDLGVLREGRLTITGREKDVIIVHGINYYSHEIEAVVEEVEGVEVSYTAACAIRDPGSDTDKLAVFFSPSSPDDDALVDLIQAIRSRTTRDVGVNPAYLIPVPKETVPKTAIGKIQRAQLKQRLEAGEFDDTLKRIDVLVEGPNTLPQWFYRESWRLKEATGLASLPRGGRYLVFLDRLGLGARLCDELARLNRRCVRVEAGSEFAQRGTDRYRIAPGDPEHYRRLLASLAPDGPPVTQVLHLWTYDAQLDEVASVEALEAAQDDGLYSLLFLAQALAQERETARPGRLLVISSHTQCVSQNDGIAYEKAPLLGLLKTIPQEMTWLDCRHVDLPATDVAADLNRVLREVRAAPGDPAVAYRDGRRLVARLERVEWGERQALPFKPGGVYLLSGGLGGIGVEIARYLLAHYRARLLLVGRTPLPKESAQRAISDPQKEDGEGQRLEALAELSQLGGELLYAAADVADPQAVQQALARAKSRWGDELDGVIHLAGVFRECLLENETRETLASVLRPKMAGAWVLHQLLRDRPHSLFISFSSVNGFFGGATVGAYAAANSFLDQFSRHQRRAGGLSSFCFAWSMWDETGMSRGYPLKDLSRARGYHSLTAGQGLRSWLAGLHHGQTQLWVGLDGDNPHLRRHVAQPAYPLQKLTAYLVQTGPAPSAELHALDVRDRFQTPSACEFRPVQHIPLTATGDVDWAQLVTLGHRARQVATERVAPRTEIERQLARIWQEVIRKEVGVYDNFFDLGGSSILIVQIQSKLQKAFGKEVSVVELFQYPTISALAEYLGSEPARAPSHEERAEQVQARSASQRRRRQMRRAHRDGSG